MKTSSSTRTPCRELEALARQAMILHNQYSWQSGKTEMVEVGALRGDDMVVTFRPRSPAVWELIRRVKVSRRVKIAKPPDEPPERPMAPLPALIVSDRFKVMPRLESLAVAKGECVCTNDDLIRNTAYCWSPMCL
jgi:3-oxoacyl-[acyl-carrier-protein] synthase III